MRWWTTALAFAATLALAAPSARADDAQIARDIIPSGQYGSFPFPAGASTQAQMFNALTPLFDHVTNADIDADFKSELFGVGPDGPATSEPVPYPGVSILRDRFDVPHVYATTHAGGVWAAGWIAAQDRGLLLAQARYDSLLAAIDAPGLDAIDAISRLDQFTPSPQTERVVARQTLVLERAGREGRDVLHDIRVFCEGINAYLGATDSSQKPFTPVDIYALNALKDQFLGEGGGQQAQDSELLSGLERRLGASRGYSVFTDLAQSTNAGSPTTIDGIFDFDHTPATPDPKGSVQLDPHSYRAAPAASPALARGLDADEGRVLASNVLMVEGRDSTTGHPLLVGGPQIGFFYPGLTYEIDMHAPGLDWRGATSAPFPGYLLIGRGRNFASSLTSAGAEDVQEFAETLCDHSRTHYLYRGRCRAMRRFDAGTLTASSGQRSPVRFETTVNGPVVGYARAGGHELAITRRRASYGRDVLDLLFNRRLSDGQVDSPQTFFRAAELTPQTFNAFYVDDRHVAEYTTGRLPIPAPGTDPELPTVGDGAYESAALLAAADHPHGVDPAHTPVPGTMVNWNNTVAHGFGAPDDNWGRNGSFQRVGMLNRALRQLRRHGKWTMAAVVSAMNEAATQDVRSVEMTPLLARVLRGSRAPNPQAARMLRALVDWHRDGSTLLDRNGDGKIDAPGAAIMQTGWARIADAVMRPELGPQLGALDTVFPRWGGYPSTTGQYKGWYQYVGRDLERLLHIHQRQPFTNSFCGRGSLDACRRSLWAALAATGRVLTRRQGTADPSRWRASAAAIAIHFAPLNVQTMQYTNRPSGIQQVISFDRH